MAMLVSSSILWTSRSVAVLLFDVPCLLPFPFNKGYVGAGTLGVMKRRGAPLELEGRDCRDSPEVDWLPLLLALVLSSSWSSSSSD